MKIEIDEEDIQKIAAALLLVLQPNLGAGKAETSDLMDVNDLCSYLKVSVKWVHERTHLKEIPFIKLSNKQLRFKKREIDKWLEGLRTPVLSELRGKLKVLR